MIWLGVRKTFNKAKFFGLNRFKSSPQKMTFYTGFDSYGSFAACAKFLDLEEETSVLSHRSKGDSERARAVGGGRRSALSLTERFFYDAGQATPRH